MVEENVTKCRECGALELRIQKGYFPDGRNKKYVNSEGLQWVGHKCPRCVKVKAKNHIKKKREDAKRRNDTQD